MIRFVLFPAIIWAVSGFQAEPEPMVAFLCNKPAVYRAESGWIRDEQTDCLNDPQAILDYCRQKYPDQNITNVVAASAAVTVDNWCGFGEPSCPQRGTHNVVPYRCLVGEFQTDSLMVPDHCLFDHMHDPKQCLNERDWQELANTACDNQARRMESFAMLKPCEVERFSGVEYVCCPRDSPMVAGAKRRAAAAPSADDADDSVEDDDDAEPDDEPDNGDAPGQAPLLPDTPPTTPQPDDDYHRYLVYAAVPAVADASEHERFSAAQRALKSLQKIKVSLLLHNWRQELDRLSMTDKHEPEKAREIAQRYQQEYDQLSELNDLETVQLQQLHEDRVMRRFMQQKKAAIGRYLSALSANDAVARGQVSPAAEKRIFRQLRHYVTVEQQDKMHWLNRFMTLKTEHPARARQMVEKTREHVDLCDRRVAEALAMLDKLPSAVASRLKTAINVFVDEKYGSINKDTEQQILQLTDDAADAAAVTLAPSPADAAIDKLPADADYVDDDDDDDEDNDNASPSEAPLDKPDNGLQLDGQDTPPRDDDRVLIDFQVIAATPAPDRSVDVDLDDSSSFENNHGKAGVDFRIDDFSQLQQRIDAAAIGDDILASQPLEPPEVAYDAETKPPRPLDEEIIEPQERIYYRHWWRTGTPYIVAGISVGLLLMLAVLLARHMRSRRSSRNPQNAYVQIDRQALPAAAQVALSPEEQWTYQMQTGGYVNPTYHYLEKQGKI